jgi:hypothetical protein
MSEEQRAAAAERMTTVRARMADGDVAAEVPAGVSVFDLED